MDVLYAVGGVNGTVQVYVSADLSDWEAAKQLMSTIRVQATCKYIPIGYDESLLPTPSPSPIPTTSPTPEPFPTVPVAAASVAALVVGVGLLVYFKKRRQEARQA